MSPTDLNWPASPHTTFKGVDGCRGGWIIATITEGALELSLSRDLSPLLHDATARVLIDMPIGLPSQHHRTCDLEGRSLLGHRRSTLFPVATREALYAETYPECCDLNSKLQGCRVSKQLWNIAPRIRELDRFMRNDTSLQERIAEGHPELAFMALCRERRPLSPKKGTEGIAERLEVINAIHPGLLTHKLEGFLQNHKRDANITDCLDAIALALLLARCGGTVFFVGDGARDYFGLTMRIAASVYALPD